MAGKSSFRKCIWTLWVHASQGQIHGTMPANLTHKPLGALSFAEKSGCLGEPLHTCTAHVRANCGRYLACTCWHLGLRSNGSWGVLTGTGCPTKKLQNQIYTNPKLRQTACPACKRFAPGATELIGVGGKPLLACVVGL